MARRVCFFLQRGSFEPAFQATSMGVTAAAMGEEVIFVLAFDALRGFVDGTFGSPRGEAELSEKMQGDRLGALSPLQMLKEARDLGAKVVACEAIVQLCGFTSADLHPLLDNVMGLASLLRLIEEAHTFSF